MKAAGEIATLNVIALDRKGRKFTNCTSAGVKFNTGDQGNVLSFVSTAKKTTYKDLTNFVQSNKDFLSLKQKFDENQSSLYLSDLLN